MVYAARTGTAPDLRSHPRNLRAEAQQRARARQRAFRKACSGLMGLCFLSLLGFAGGLDAGGALLPGAIGMGLSLGGFALFGTLAGIIEW